MAMINPSKLSGLALDWAVAKCEGLNPNTDYSEPAKYGISKGFREANGFGKFIESYHKDWSKAGAIIVREGISIAEDKPGLWRSGPRRMPMVYYAPDPLVAAMRCYVASKMGDIVKIPDYLIVKG